MNGIPPVPPSPPPRTAQTRADGAPIERAAVVKAYEAPWKALSGPPAPAQAPESSGAALRLSAIGRLIAALLAERAAAPGVVRSPLALLRRGEAPTSALVQTRLRASIEESGLFYESHLRRWFLKEFPGASLRREPQMRLAPSAPDQARAPLRPGATPHDPPPPDRARAALESERDLRTSDLLRPLVGHQLELLSTPVLRWEGEFWNGIYMSLLIHLPDDGRELEYLEDEARDEEEADANWRLELSLDIAALGLLRARAALCGERLSLLLQAEAPPLLERLRGHQGALAERLRLAGFTPEVRIEATEDADGAAAP